MSNLSMLEVEDWKKTKYSFAYNILKKFNDFYPHDKHLLMKYPRKKIIERNIRIDKISNYLHKGEDTVTVDLGCQFGQMTKLLQKITRGKIYGIERNSKFLSEINNENKKIKYIVTDILNWKPPSKIRGKVNQILCSSFLHEVYSQYGIDGYHNVISLCKDLLRKKGRLIIIDGVSADEEIVKIKFRELQTRNQFDKFNTLYKPFKIEYRDIDELFIEVDFSKFSRFLINLKFVVPDNLNDYEKTLINVKDMRQTIARAFYLMDFYTQPISNFEEEFNQDVVFFSYKKWKKSMDRFNLAISYIHLWNERDIESYFVRSGIDIITPQKEIPKNHVIMVCSKC